MYRPVLLLSAVESGGEHQHVIVAFESRLHHKGEVTSVASRLVDADAYWGESGEIHQQVVNQIAEASIVVSSDNGSESHAVLTTKRMVGDEGVKASVVSGWQVLLAHNLDVHLQVAHARLKPFHPAEVTAFPYKLIDLILMDKAFKPRH